MDSTDAGAFHAAEPDPVASGAAYAIEHLNDDHADALLLMARSSAGHPDATEATCARIDRYGLDLQVQTPRGFAERGSRSPSGEPPGDLRAATVSPAPRGRDRLNQRASPARLVAARARERVLVRSARAAAAGRAAEACF